MKLKNKIIIGIAIGLFVPPLVVGSVFAAWVFLFNHAVKIILACAGIYLFVRVLHWLDDVRSRYWFEVCEVFRRADAKRHGWERTQNERDRDWASHEWLRLIRAARFREADKARHHLERLESGSPATS